MANLEFAPKEKSDAYWQRETTANGRKINDALDKHEDNRLWRNVSAQTGNARKDAEGEYYNGRWAAAYGKHMSRSSFGDYETTTADQRRSAAREPDYAGMSQRDFQRPSVRDSYSPADLDREWMTSKQWREAYGEDPMPDNAEIEAGIVSPTTAAREAAWAAASPPQFAGQSREPVPQLSLKL